MGTRDLIATDGDNPYQRLVNETDENSDKVVEAADVIIMFPNPFLDEAAKKEAGINDSETVDGNDFLENVFVAKKKTAEPSSWKILKQLAKVCEDKKPTKKDIIIALLDDFCQWFSNCGWQVKLFKSADEDEIFMRVSIDNEEVQQFYAEKSGLRLQLTPNVVEALGIKQPYDEISPAYIPYDDDLEQKAKALGLPHLFEMYYGKYKKGCIFRTVDRVAIMYRIMRRIVDLEALTEKSVMLAHFPVHYKASLEEFRIEWATFKLKKLADPFASQPLRRIRDYFGEAIAFYFVWVGYTVRAFVLLSAAGIGVKIFEALDPFGVGQKESRAICALIFMAFMVGWTSGYMVFWTRLQKYWTERWDMANASSRAITRSDFRGEMKPDPVDENQKCRQYPRWKKISAQVFAACVTFMFLGLCVGSVGYIFSLKETLIETYGKKGKTMASVMLSVQIKVLNFIWGMVAPALVKLQNPKTDFEYSNTYIVLLFVFQAFVSYNPFVYIGFFQGHTEMGCPHDDCIALLRSTLYSTFASLCVLSVVEMAVPYAKLWWSLKKEKDAITALMKKKGLASTEVPKRSFMEKQGKMAEYSLEDKITDEIAIVISIGYVLLFCVVAPGVSFMALVLLALQVRCDAWKLCTVHRRPFPIVADGIGAWNSVLKVIEWLSLTCSVGLPIMNLHYLDEYSIKDKVLIFFCVERAMAGIKLIFFLVPELPARVELMRARRIYVIDQLLMGKDSDANLASGLKPTPPSLKEIPQLTQSSLEWTKVDKDDDVDGGEGPDELKAKRMTVTDLPANRDLAV